MNVRPASPSDAPARRWRGFPGHEIGSEHGVATLPPVGPAHHLRDNDYLPLAAEGALLMGVPILIAIAGFVIAVALHEEPYRLG